LLTGNIPSYFTTDYDQNENITNQEAIKSY